MLDGFDREAFMNNITELASVWGLKVLGAIAVLIIGVVAAKMIRAWLKRIFSKANVDATLIPFLSSMAYYLVLAVVVVATLGLFGVETASIVAVMGAAAFAVGLALQGTLSNFAAGVLLLILRPFRVGDFVETGSVKGGVAEVGIFFTTLNTPDNVRVIVPNSQVFGQIIKNYNANDRRRIDMTFGVAYTDDIAVAIRVIRETLEAHAKVLKDPAPVVEVAELADSSVNIVARPWCETPDYWALWFEMHRTIKEKLEAAGCSIPFPQRDVHLFQETNGAK